ncbi:phage tail protein [Chryseobacterium geocarposphaerae]|uniref:Uncharacterized protein n=1 Tax=Chryseobacterium geocarposphaerae TaxID=1416776 RepID=A0A2M9C9J4_9FLAO|nr:hypothetical protein [Chryseobacterium geocarposphaerae]PJJ67452.1 hypothetical protein CLV73_1465 [Chryseobacterium geocarposphaerae]
MKAATPVEKDNAHQSPSRKQRQQESVVPLSEVEITNAKKQNSGDLKGIAGSANPNQFNLNSNVMAVHGSQTIYDQGSQMMHKKHQESLTQTGDINHPDTKETEKDYLTTLNTNQAQNYNDLKSGTYLPKMLEEQVMVHQQSKKIEETNPAVKPVDKKDTPIKSDANQSQAVNPDKAEAGEIEKVSPNANSNPEFTALSGNIANTAKLQKQHEPSQKASNDAQAAAPSPSNERQSMAQASQVNTMDEQKAGMFSKKDFKAQLTEKIENITLPENEEQADEFEKHNNIDEVNQKAVGDVKKEKNIASNDIASATSAQPNTNAQPTRAVAKMPTPNIGKAPGIPNAAKAMPVKRNVESVEQPIKEQTASIDNEMQANGVTDNMLAKSNEPTFTDALAQKNKAKTQSVEATQQFRDKENKELSKTRTDAQAQAASHISGMHDVRKGGLGNVHGEQKQTSGKDSQKRKEIADHINSIYQSSKTDVNSILNSLDKTVADKFARGSVDAKKAFEVHVNEGMKAYKKKRYGDAYAKYGLLGLAGKWVKDQVVGLPPEVNKYFVSGKALYIKTMDKYIDDIAGHVTNQLNAAKTRIAKGKKDVQTYVNSLSPSLRKIGKDAITEIQAKFNALEESVNNKKDALIDVLAKKYADNIASIDTRIADLKAQNSGLVNQVLDVLKNSVFAIIIEIKNTLTNLLSGVISAIQSIIMDPIGFFRNLIAGVSQGFTNFGANIWTHLKTGFFGWLTGAMKGISLTMPEDVFSLKGIFSITTQVLGLTWGGIRSIGARVIGEPVMKVLETASEKGLEIVQVVRKEGAAGLWEYLKDQFADLKATVMDTIMDIVQTQVIQAGIKWVMGLLTPVGAFIKAAMAIIDVVKFFIQRAAQIMELVKAFSDSIKAIASGNVGAVAKSIENALGRAVPVLIGFLASLLGIGGLADKVLGVIRKIRQRIENAIVKFWNFVKVKAKGLFGKIGFGGKKDKKEKKVEDKRTTAEKEKDLRDGLNEAKEYAKNTQDAEKIRKKLPEIKEQYDMKSLKMVIDGENENLKTIHFEGEVNPKGVTVKIDIKKESFGELAVGKHPLKGKDRESHHVPENKFMDRIEKFYGRIGKKINKEEKSKEVKDFQDIAEKLLQREADIAVNFPNHGNNLSAILLHKDTHRESDEAVHSKELQKDVIQDLEKYSMENKEIVIMGYDGTKKTKRAQMRKSHWDNYIKEAHLLLKRGNIDLDSFVVENKGSFIIKSPGNKAGAFDVISKDIAEKIQELFNKFTDASTTREYREELKSYKREILKTINDIAEKSYESALTVGLQTVATALSKSDNDGDKSEHPKALDKLKEIANVIWRNHIIKKINL